jgi:Right handed beta helix region
MLLPRHRTSPVPLVAFVICAFLSDSRATEKLAPIDKPIGANGPVGCLDKPKKVERLEITKPGVYENYLVDSNWAGGNRVKITADDVTLRHCEIRNATGNGVGVFGKNVTIENCKIHHLLAGSFKDQQDAHGITGRWNNVTIRNCEIYLVSGDCFQFDPDRKSTGSVRIENCTLWTGPLPEDAGKFRKGERPGENAVDTKAMADGARSTLTVRNCYMHGFRQPAQISNVAALNIKENVQATVENCLFRDNEIAFRLRGPGKRGGALVSIKNCAIFDGETGVRMEDKIKDLKIDRLGFGAGVNRKYHPVAGGTGTGYENKGEFTPPAFDEVLKRGFPALRP